MIRFVKAFDMGCDIKLETYNTVVRVFLKIVAVLFIGAIPVLANDSPLRILEMPRPESPKYAGTLCAQGTVRLLVEFRGDGRIGAIVPIIDMPVRNLTGLATAAAQNIKFEPEIKSGVPIDVSRLVEYHYSWKYGGWRPAHPGRRKTSEPTPADEDAEAILKRAIDALGGDRYLNVTSQIGRGRFSIMRDGMIISFQSFYDVVVYPDRERTEFRSGKSKLVQANSGETGWVYESDLESIKDQTEFQLENFKRGTRVSINNLLRGHWRGEATLSFAGTRPASLGKRNNIVKLTYEDGFEVEFEFSQDDGLPQKALFVRTNINGDTTRDEDRYAQYIEVSGIRSPFIIDRFSNDKHVSRINYESVEYNKRVPDDIFLKPTNPRELRRDLRL
jgi:hypothetical protein